jgi:hypothetical protein
MLSPAIGWEQLGNLFSYTARPVLYCVEDFDKVALHLASSSRIGTFFFLFVKGETIWDVVMAWLLVS